MTMRVLILLMLSGVALADETLLHCDGIEYFNYTFQMSSETSQVVSLAFEDDSVNMSTYGDDIDVAKHEIVWTWQIDRKDRRFLYSLDTVSGKLSMTEFHHKTNIPNTAISVVRFQCERVSARIIQ